MLALCVPEIIYLAFAGCVTCNMIKRLNSAAIVAALNNFRVSSGPLVKESERRIIGKNWPAPLSLGTTRP